MKESRTPYRCSIYWKQEGTTSAPVVTVYSMDCLMRLNPVASIIWLLLDGRHTEERIQKMLQDCFQHASAQLLQKHLDKFLSQAEALGLIVRCWHPLQPYQVLSERLVR